MNKKEAILKISKFLINRKFVFYNKYPNASKQQIIINAEQTLSIIKNLPDNRFFGTVGTFADKYILPLLPSQKSRYRANFEYLYQQLKNPTIQ